MRSVHWKFHFNAILYARCDFYVKQFLDFTCTENLNYIRKRVGSVFEELLHTIGKEWNKIRKKKTNLVLYMYKALTMPVEMKSLGNSTKWKTLREKSLTLHFVRCPRSFHESCETNTYFTWKTNVMWTFSALHFFLLFFSLT